MHGVYEELSPQKEMSTLCNEIQRCQAQWKLYVRKTASVNGVWVGVGGC